MGLVLEWHTAVPVGQVSRQELRKDGFLEYLAHIFRCDVEALLDVRGFHIFLLHLIVVFAYLVEDDTVLVVDTVLADLPKSDSRDGIDPNVELCGLDDSICHLYHGFFLLVADLTLAADSDNHMTRLHDGNEINLEFEHIVHFLDEFLPVPQRQPNYFGDIELLEVVFLLEAGRIDRVCSHVLNRQNILVLLSFLTSSLL